MCLVFLLMQACPVWDGWHTFTDKLHDPPECLRIREKPLVCGIGRHLMCFLTWQVLTNILFQTVSESSAFDQIVSLASFKASRSFC